MQPKVIGYFGRDEQRGGCDKAAKQLHLHGGTEPNPHLVQPNESFIEKVIIYSQ